MWYKSSVGAVDHFEKGQFNPPTAAAVRLFFGGEGEVPTQNGGNGLTHTQFALRLERQQKICTAAA